MMQHGHLVWVQSARSKPLQRGSWWVNDVPQVRLDRWEGCWGDDPKLCTAAFQRGTRHLGYPGDDCPLPKASGGWKALLCSHDDLSIRQSRKNALFADHLLLVAFSGFVFPSDILFSGHTTERWACVQPNHSLLRRHSATQNTRFVPSWQLGLPGGFTPLLAAGTCLTSHHPWPCRLRAHQLPLRTRRTLPYVVRRQEQSPPAVLSTSV